jgi:hypothetical protein
LKNTIRRMVPAAALTAVLVAVPAHAKKPDLAGPQAATEHGHGQHSGRCKPHTAGWTVGGTVVESTIADNGDGTFSGDLVVTVARTNSAARAERKGDEPKSYTLTNVRASFDDLPDANGDGAVDAADVAAGDRVRLVGRVAKPKRRCAAPDSTVATIRKVAFAAPAPAPGSESDEG